MLDDAHDEGEEAFTQALSNASGARQQDAKATGTIENANLMPAGLPGSLRADDRRAGGAARRGADGGASERASGRGFAGRECQPGMERDLALAFPWQFGEPMDAGIGVAPMGAAPMGAVSMGTAPMAMDSHKGRRRHPRQRRGRDRHEGRDRHDGFDGHDGPACAARRPRRRSRR